MSRAATDRNHSRRQPIQLWRVRCGKKVWSPWLTDQVEAWWRAHHLGLARYDYKRGIFMPGPLTWIERGERAYAGRRTMPLRVDAKGQPLPPINLPTMRLD